MDDRPDWLAEQFQAHRTHLRAVAHRILGSPSEADDAVQEAWLRLSRSDTSDVANLGGWLTTVVARICLNMLRSRKTRREEPLDVRLPEPAVDAGATDPEHEAVLADSVGLALLVVLDTLAPAERVAFVLHDMFAVPFDEIAPIVRRSSTATRQLASRARRRVQATGGTPEADLARQRDVVGAFLAASRNGDFDALLALLDPDVELRADQESVQAAAASAPRGGPRLASHARGAPAVASTFLGRAAAAQLALVDGAPGAVWAPGGRPRAVLGFTIVAGKIVGIDIVSNPDRVDQLDLAILAS